MMQFGEFSFETSPIAIKIKNIILLIGKMSSNLMTTFPFPLRQLLFKKRKNNNNDKNKSQITQSIDSIVDFLRDE
jgi:hypothetical protein